jgi:hypothetical protein
LVVVTVELVVAEAVALTDGTVAQLVLAEEILAA